MPAAHKETFFCFIQRYLTKNVDNEQNTEPHELDKIELGKIIFHIGTCGEEFFFLSYIIYTYTVSLLL